MTYLLPLYYFWDILFLSKPSIFEIVFDNLEWQILHQRLAVSSSKSKSTMVTCIALDLVTFSHPLQTIKGKAMALWMNMLKVLLEEFIFQYVRMLDFDNIL